MPELLPLMNPKEKIRISIRFGYTDRNGVSGNTHVCTINANRIRNKLIMIFLKLLFIDLRPRVL